MAATKVSFRLDETLADVLEELSRRARLDTSSTLRELIRLAGAGEALWPPPTPTEAECVALLAEKARAGSVTATVVLLRHVSRDSKPDRAGGTLDALDEPPNFLDTLRERHRARRNGNGKDPQPAA